MAAAAGAVATPQAVRRSRRETRERLTFLAFVLPNLCLLAIFSYWPLIQNAYLSFVEWDMISPEKLWVGLDNWHFVFTDRIFQRILANTLVFTIASVGATSVTLYSPIHFDYAAGVRFRSEEFWPGRLPTSEPIIIERPPVLYDFSATVREDVNDI